MSAMIGSGEPFLISIIACAASFVGTATRTIRQFASLRRAISLSVALTSRVSALVMDWTTISAAPPMTTSPTRTGTDLRRVLMTSSQHIVICHQSDQSKQESQPHVVHDLLPSRIDMPSPDPFKYQEGGPTVTGVFLAASSAVGRSSNLLIGCELTARMTSPGWSPALYAGVPVSTALTSIGVLTSA